MSKYQQKIIQDLKDGAILQCTEGSNYKTWLIYPDGSTKRIRRDSAEKICTEQESNLIFGGFYGIKWIS